MGRVRGKPHKGRRCFILQRTNVRTWIVAPRAVSGVAGYPPPYLGPSREFFDAGRGRRGIFRYERRDFLACYATHSAKS